MLGREEPDQLKLDGRYYETLDEEGHAVKAERVAKPKDVRVLTSFTVTGAPSASSATCTRRSPATW